MKILTEHNINDLRRKGSLSHEAVRDDNIRFRESVSKKNNTPEYRQIRATEKLISAVMEILKQNKADSENIAKAMNKLRSIEVNIPEPKETPVIVNIDRPKEYVFTITRDNYGLIKNVTVKEVEE